jgi:acyl carrier protein
MTQLTYDDVFAVVRGALVTVLEVDPANVTKDTRLIDDLHCDSLAIVELAEIAEESIPGLRIDDADLDHIATVGEAVDYVLARL